MKLLLNTGRTIHQGDTVERKNSPSYETAVSVCYLHPVDMMELFLEEGDHVRVESKTGSVVLRAVPTESVRRGSAFVPLGPYANHIIAAETHSTGMPDFKSMDVLIEATSEPVPTLADLMGLYGGLPYAH